MTVTYFVVVTFWFRLLLFLLWLLPQLRWGIVHEALDHVGSNQSNATECPLLHHKQRQRRVEVSLLWQLLNGPDTGKGSRIILAVSLFCMDVRDKKGNKAAFL